MWGTRAQAARSTASGCSACCRERPPARRRRHLRVRSPRSTCASTQLSGTGSSVYAQNMHQAETGAFTGEVSAPMLVELGANGVVLGHSERRQLFGETDRALQEKVPAALAAGLRPILCVGETEEEREAGETERKLRHQVQEGAREGRPRAAGRGGDRLRADLGDRHRQGRHARDRRRRRSRSCARWSATARQEAAERGPRALRRQRQARQRGRDPGPAGRRRRAGGRRQPGSGRRSPRIVAAAAP